VSKTFDLGAAGRAGQVSEIDPPVVEDDGIDEHELAETLAAVTGALANTPPRNPMPSVDTAMDASAERTAEDAEAGDGEGVAVSDADGPVAAEATDAADPAPSAVAVPEDEAPFEEPDEDDLLVLSDDDHAEAEVAPRKPRRIWDMDEDETLMHGSTKDDGGFAGGTRASFDTEAQGDEVSPEARTAGPAQGRDAPISRDPSAVLRAAVNSRPRTTPPSGAPAAPEPRVLSAPRPPALKQSALGEAAQAAAAAHAASAPASGGAPRRSGRVKTRMLGFQSGGLAGPDVFEGPVAQGGSGQVMFPVGWIVVIGGPGRGAAFPLFNGVSQIGRGEDQAVQLDFGDTAVSRQNHAAIAYDDETRRFFLGHGGKSNLVRLNGRPVLSTEDIADGDTIRIGETTLRFVALCGEGFSWENSDDENASHVAAE
jgi:hypothetical protein